MIMPPFEPSLPYDTEEMYHLLDELLAMLQSDIVHESKDLWLRSWREFFDVGEWQMLFGALCEVLEVYHVSISEGTYGQLKRIGEVLYFRKPETWEQLKPYVR